MPQDPFSDSSGTSGSKPSSGTGAAMGGGITLLIVIVIGLKVWAAVNRASSNNPPPTNYQPVQPYIPPPQIAVTPPSGTVLLIPPTTPPDVKDSKLEIKDWAVTTFADLGFRIYVPPDEPEVDSLDVTTEKKHKTGVRRVWRLNDGDLVLLAQQQLDLKDIDLYNNPAFSQLFTDQFVIGLTSQGKDIKKTPITFRGIPGRDLTWVDDEGAHRRARLIFRKNHHFLLMSSTNEDLKDDPAIAAFFDSFDFATEK